MSETEFSKSQLSSLEDYKLIILILPEPKAEHVTYQRRGLQACSFLKPVIKLSPAFNSSVYDEKAPDLRLATLYKTDHRLISFLPECFRRGLFYRRWIAIAGSNSTSNCDHRNPILTSCSSWSVSRWNLNECLTLNVCIWNTTAVSAAY